MTDLRTALLAILIISSPFGFDFIKETYRVKPTWPVDDMICGPFWPANPAFLYCRPASEVKEIFGITEVPGAKQAPPRISVPIQPGDMSAIHAPNIN